MKIRHVVVVCSAVAGALAGCGEATPMNPMLPATSSTASSMLATTGGTVTLAVAMGQSASIEVPSGALAQPARLTVRSMGNAEGLPSGQRAAGPVIAFEPEGQTFAMPVRILVPSTEPAVGLFTRPLAGGDWTAVEGATYREGSRAMGAEVSRLGQFVATVTSTQTYPAGPYGSGVGATFRPFGLEACANHQGEWRFDQPDFFSSRATLMIISAGWCQPCRVEAAQLEREINTPYRSMGLRVVQVLVQDNTVGRAITRSTCEAWPRQYRLTQPILMDPEFRTSPYVPRAAFPGNVLVDRQGRIRWRSYGTEHGLAQMKAAIEDVLANPDP